MSEQDLSPAEVARLLAELHIARGLGRQVAAPREVGAGGIAVAELWAHARRAPGAPVSLAVERALRSDPAAARRYRTMLASAAVAHAPLAIAASTGAVAARRVGEIVITIDEGEEGAAPLVILSNIRGRAPGLIEILLVGEALRLALPEPVGEAIMLSADPAIPEMAALLRLLRDPGSEIFLL